MSTRQQPPGARLRLPINPSIEHLRKQAKRLHGQRPSLSLQQAQHQLAKAYGCRDWEELTTMVERMARGADQLHGDRSSESPLAAAVNREDLDGARAILAAGTFTRHDLDLALARAVLAFSRRQEFADLLMEHGADPDGQYGSGYGPLALVTGECLDPDGLQFLIDHRADVAFAPLMTTYGETSMLGNVLGTYLRGANARKHRCIAILLEHGAPLPSAVTPALLAIHRGDVMELRRLLAADPALVHRTCPAMPYGNVALGGATLLHCAVEFDELDYIRELLAHGADINRRAEPGGGHLGQTPVFHALNSRWADKIRTLELLVELAGERLDPLLTATFSRYGEPRATAVSALAWAEEPGDEQRAAADRERALLRVVAQRRALREAIARTDARAVADLLAQGADANHRGEDGLTPLHLAVAGSSLSIAETLLDHGARPWLEDQRGRRPVEVARELPPCEARDALVATFSEVRIDDADLRAAVAALDAGDVESLSGLLRQHPAVLTLRVAKAAWFAGPYFTRPTLLHFVANNPTRRPTMPLRILEAAQAILDAGAVVDARTADANGSTTLQLVASSGPARADGFQLPLIRLLVRHGADPACALGSAIHEGYWDTASELRRLGAPLTLVAAAGVGEEDELVRLLAMPTAPAQLLEAAAVAAKYGRTACLAHVLDAGAPLDEPLPGHPFRPTMLHQAAWSGHRDAVELLLARGADASLRDAQYRGTPADWARTNGHAELAQIIAQRR